MTNAYNNAEAVGMIEQINKVGSERRQCDRVQSVLSGIILVDGEFTHQCIINEVSMGGMRLTLEKKAELPDIFTVKTPSILDGIDVELAWQRGTAAGVKFVSFTE